MRISNALDRNADGKDINKMLWEVAECLNLVKLRYEIIDLLVDRKIDASSFKDDDQWKQFALSLLEELKGQPIRIKNLDDLDDKTNCYEKAVKHFQTRHKIVVVSLSIEHKKDDDPPPVCARLKAGVWTLKKEEPKGLFVWLNLQFPCEGNSVPKAK